MNWMDVCNKLHFFQHFYLHTIKCLKLYYYVYPGTNYRVCHQNIILVFFLWNNKYITCSTDWNIFKILWFPLDIYRIYVVVGCKVVFWILMSEICWLNNFLWTTIEFCNENNDFDSNMRQMCASLMMRSFCISSGFMAFKGRAQTAPVGDVTNIRSVIFRYLHISYISPISKHSRGGGGGGRFPVVRTGIHKCFTINQSLRLLLSIASVFFRLILCICCRFSIELILLNSLIDGKTFHYPTITIITCNHFGNNFFWLFNIYSVFNERNVCL